MNARQWIACAVGVILWQAAHADGSYEETSQITGGTMKQIIGLSSIFSPSASREMGKAASDLTIVSGNRMVHITAAATVIFDLDSQTLTRIDSKKKQYAVATFDELQKQAEAAAQKAQAALDEHKGDLDQASSNLPPELSQIPTSCDTKVTDTGATKTIEGIPAHEVLLTSTMTFKDPKGGNDTVTYYYKRDVWLANSVPPGYQEIEDFKKRMAGKLTFNSQKNPFALLAATHPGLAEGLKKAGAEMAKQQGVAVMVVEQLGGHAEGDSVTAAANTAPAGQGSSMTNEVISGAASEAAQREAGQLTDSSKLGPLSSSLLNSAVSIFQRHSADLTKSATSSVTSATSKSDNPASVDRVLMETTTVTSSFSTEKAPAAAFEVPAGFTRIDWHLPATDKM
jgi:hypothetical protein